MEDDRRQHQCLKKYEVVLKQFDELVDMVDGTTKPHKKRKQSMVSEGDKATTARQTHLNEVLVETITRFLHELDRDS